MIGRDMTVLWSTCVNIELSLLDLVCHADISVESLHLLNSFYGNKQSSGNELTSSVELIGSHPAHENDFQVEGLRDTRKLLKQLKPSLFAEANWVQRRMIKEIKPSLESCRFDIRNNVVLCVFLLSKSLASLFIHMCLCICEVMTRHPQPKHVGSDIYIQISIRYLQMHLHDCTICTG